MIMLRGCTNAPFKVTTDPQWEAFKAALKNTPKSVNDVKVNVNWNELKKWKPVSDDSVSFSSILGHIPPISSIRKTMLRKGPRYVRFGTSLCYSIDYILGP